MQLTAFSKGYRLSMAHSSRMNSDLISEYKKKIGHPDNTLIEDLRAHCLAKGCSGIQGIGRAFRIMDQDGNRTLSFEEFSVGIKHYGVLYDNKKMRELFQSIDVDGTGTIDYEEFLRALRPPMSKARVNLVQMAFDKLDRVKDGVINVEDLKGVYSVKKHPDYLNGSKTEEQLLRTFLDTFDMDHDGQVTFDEFLNYYSGVSASIDTDIYFDLMMRQAWKL